MQVSALAGGMALWGNFWVSALEGLQRMQWSNLLTSAGAGLSAAGILWAVFEGKPLVDLMWVNFFSASAAVLLGAFLLWHLSGWTPLSRTGALQLRPFLKYGFHMQVLSIGSLLGEPLAKFAVGRIISVAAVGYFELGYRVALSLKNIFTAGVSPLIPAVAEAQKVDPERTLQLYSRFTRWVGVLGTPAFLFLYVGSEPLLKLWLKSPTPEAVLTAHWMAIVMLISLVGVPAFMASQGVDRPSYAAQSMLISSGTVALTVSPLLMYFGYPGVLWSYLASALLSSLFVIKRFHGLMGLPLAYTVRSFSPRLLVAAACLIAIVSAVFAVTGHLGAAAKTALVAAAATVYLVLYLCWEARADFQDVRRASVAARGYNVADSRP